jgi:hypothetical protein
VRSAISTRGWSSPITNNQRVGQLVCERTTANNTNNDFRMVWTFDSASIAVIADGGTGMAA